MKTRPRTFAGIASLVTVAVILVSALPGAGNGASGAEDMGGLAPAPAPGRERHDPIRIQGDHDLLAPPPVGDDDGIRGGTGTQDDPFIIANWTIESGDEPAIYIDDVTLWVEIRNVTVVQEEVEDSSFGIFVRNVDHIAIVGSNVTGLQTMGVYVQESNLVIRDSRIAIHSTPDPHAEYPGGPVGTLPAFWEGRGVGVSYHAGVSLRIVGTVFDRTPIFVKPECVCNGTDLTFVDNTVRPYNGTLDRGYFRGDRIRIASNKGYVYYRMDLWDAAPRATFRDNQAEALKLRGDHPDEDDTAPEVVVPVRDNTFRGPSSCDHRRVAYADRSTKGTLAYADPGCRRAVSVGSGFAPRLRFVISGNRFEQIRGTAVDVHNSRVSIRRNVFVDSGATENPRVWIRADYESYRDATDADVPYQEVTRNDFVRDPAAEWGLALYYMMSHSKSPTWGEAEAPVALPGMDNYWGPAGPPDVRPRSEVVGGAIGGRFDEMAKEPAHPKWVIFGNVTVEPHAAEPNVLSMAEVQRYLEEDRSGSLLGGTTPAGWVTGGLLVVAVGSLYARRKRVR